MDGWMDGRMYGLVDGRVPTLRPCPARAAMILTLTLLHLSPCSAIGIFMNQIMHGEPMTIFGTGNQTRGFSYISDVAPLIAVAPGLPKARNEAFFVGTDKEYSVYDLSVAVAKAMGVPHQVNNLPARNEVVDAFASHDKLRCFFNPNTPVPLEKGLKVSERATERATSLEATSTLVRIQLLQPHLTRASFIFTSLTLTSLASLTPALAHHPRSLRSTARRSASSSQQASPTLRSGRRCRRAGSRRCTRGRPRTRQTRQTRPRAWAPTARSRAPSTVRRRPRTAATSGTLVAPSG